MDPYEKEAELSASILQRNRHSSITGKWFGPVEEPNPASRTCSCSGCHVRFYLSMEDLHG